MDTDRLIQRLFELRTLINKLYPVDDLPDVKDENVLSEIFASLRSELPAKQPAGGAANQTGLHWLLKAEEHLLEESQQQLLLLQNILQNSLAGMAVVSGPDLIFRLATPAYRAMPPYVVHSLIGKNYAEVWPADQGFDSEKVIRQMIKEGKNLQFEQIELRYPDGLIHSFTMRLCPLRWHDQPGALIQMQETTQTDRARQIAIEIAQETHRQAEELNAIISAMAEAVILFDAAGQAIRANPAAIELYSIDPVGLDHFDLIEILILRHPDGSLIEIGDLPTQKAMDGETVSGQRLLLMDSDGRERMVRVSASPLFYEERVSGVVTVWHDVTERERLLEQLEIEQSRLETIILTAPEAILVSDEEGRLVLGNSAAEHLFGQALPYGKDIESLKALQFCYMDGAPYDPRNMPLVSSALDGQSLNNVEMQVVLPDQQVRYILASTAPIVDRKRNLNGAVGVFQDITQHKQAEENLRQRASRSQLLATLSRAFAEAGLNYRDLLDTIVSQVGSVFGELCCLNLISDDGKWYDSAIHFSNNRHLFIQQPADQARPTIEDILHNAHLPAAQKIPGQVLQKNQMILIRDIDSQQLEKILPFIYHLFSQQAVPAMINGAIVPLRTHGRNIGTLNLLRFQPHAFFTTEDQTFLQDLADRAALAIENTRLYGQETRRARELQALNQATTALLSTIDMETLLAQILESAHQAIPAAEQGVLYLCAPDGDRLDSRASFGSDNVYHLNSVLEHHAARAVREKRPLLLNEIATKADRTNGEPYPPSSAILAPLMLPQRVLGALALFGSHKQLFTENDLRLLSSFAATATAALQNAELYAQVERLATTDTVTEQFNRRKFFELGELEMQRFHRFHHPLSAIMLDLDNFKEVNDTYGHASGDQVLRAVAQRCHNNIRQVDILGRYGGDEFAILLPQTEIKKAFEIAERIRQAVMQDPVAQIHISISMGLAQATEDMDNLSALLGRADGALYAAKQSGRNRVMLDHLPT